MKSVAITILVVLTVFLVSTIAAYILADYLGMWNELATGIIVAPVVVFVAYFRTEKRKIIAASIAYIIGAAASIYILKNGYYPESYEKAYEPTILPLFSTLTSGAVALLIIAITERNKEKKEE